MITKTLSLSKQPSLQQQQQQSSNQVFPETIQRMLQELYSRGPTTVGIFRKSPSVKQCKEVRQQVERNADTQFDDIPITVVASVFKEWLRSMPDCLLTSKLYDQWIDVTKQIESSQSQSSNIECQRIVKKLIDSLDEPNFLLLKSLICVLKHIANNSNFNNMSAQNLGICIGQSMLNESNPTAAKRHRRSRSQCLLTLSWSSLSSSSSSANSPTNFCRQSSNAQYVPLLVAYMIENANVLFGSDLKNLFENNCSNLANNKENEASEALTIKNCDIKNQTNDNSSNQPQHMRQEPLSAIVNQASMTQNDPLSSTPKQQIQKRPQTTIVVKPQTIVIKSQQTDCNANLISKTPSPTASENLTSQLKICPAMDVTDCSTETLRRSPITRQELMRRRHMMNCYSTILGVPNRYPKIPIFLTTSDYSGGEAVIYNPPANRIQVQQNRPIPYTLV